MKRELIGKAIAHRHYRVAGLNRAQARILRWPDNGKKARAPSRRAQRDWTFVMFIWLKDRKKSLYRFAMNDAALVCFLPILLDGKFINL